MGMRLPAERGDGARRARLKIVLSLGVVIVAVATPGLARATDVTFVPTGAEQTFTVPAGVRTVHAVAVGGKGGDGAESGGAGGFGALASADLAVTPGQTLYIEVGGNGGSTGGFNGGGAGGPGLCEGGAGGGASDVRTATRAAGTSLQLRLITAAGGGGGGGCDPSPGTPKGTGGTAGAAGGDADAGGGQPGTSTGGGAGGAGGCDGMAGSLAAGGAGADGACLALGAGGGGGGGGVFGGGGGGDSSAAGGGGGGSSGFADSAMAISVAVDTTGAPSITLVYEGPPSPPAKKPKLTGLSLTNATFRAGKTSTPLTGAAAAKHHKVGTRFSFRLDRTATVKIAIQRRPPGRRVNGMCKRPTHKLRHRPRCTRTIKIATLSRNGHAGLNRIAFSGRIGGKALQPGNYRAVFTPTNAAGPSSPKSLTFTIARH